MAPALKFITRLGVLLAALALLWVRCLLFLVAIGLVFFLLHVVLYWLDIHIPTGVLSVLVVGGIAVACVASANSRERRMKRERKRDLGGLYL